MKGINRRMHLRTVLICLALAAAITFPVAVTQSKYVWQDDLEVELVITYGDQELTSLLPEGDPSEFWVQELQNIKATPTADGLLLAAEEGYVLPEFITVDIGQMTYSVKTDGTDSTEGISFDPGSGLLSVAENLIRENAGGVTVRAAALEEVSQEPGLEENV